MIIIRELSNLLDEACSFGESFENLSDVGAWLHRNDSQLVFFVYPSQESLVIIMEDTSVLWPLSVETTSVKESIPLLKEEMVSNELLSIFL